MNIDLSIQRNTCKWLSDIPINAYVCKKIDIPGVHKSNLEQEEELTCQKHCARNTSLSYAENWWHVKALNQKRKSHHRQEEEEQPAGECFLSVH